MSCLDCKYWFPKDEIARFMVSEYTNGRCFRYPPQAVYNGSKVEYVQPKTHGASWCGEFIQREE